MTESAVVYPAKKRPEPKQGPVHPDNDISLAPAWCRRTAVEVSMVLAGSVLQRTETSDQTEDERRVGGSRLAPSLNIGFPVPSVLVNGLGEADCNPFEVAEQPEWTARLVAVCEADRLRIESVRFTLIARRPRRFPGLPREIGNSLKPFSPVPTLAGSSQRLLQCEPDIGGVTLLGPTRDRRTLGRDLRDVLYTVRSHDDMAKHRIRMDIGGWGTEVLVYAGQGTLVLREIRFANDEAVETTKIPGLRAEERDGVLWYLRRPVYRRHTFGSWDRIDDSLGQTGGPPGRGLYWHAEWAWKYVDAADRCENDPGCAVGGPIKLLDQESPLEGKNAIKKIVSRARSYGLLICDPLRPSRWVLSDSALELLGIAEDREGVTRVG
jgi:hypothetical protein